MVAKAPVPKMADMPSLRFVLIWRLQTMMIGTASMARSETELNTADDMYKDEMSKHFPGVSVIQILRRGRHAKMLMKKATE